MKLLHTTKCVNTHRQVIKKKTLHIFSLGLGTRKMFEPPYIFKLLSLFIFLSTSHSNPIASQFSTVHIGEWTYSGHQLSSVQLSFISTPMTHFLGGLIKVLWNIYQCAFLFLLFSPCSPPSLWIHLPYEFSYDQMTPAASSLYQNRSYCIAQQFSTSWQAGAWGHIEPACREMFRSWGCKWGRSSPSPFFPKDLAGLKHLASCDGEFAGDWGPSAAWFSEGSHWNGEKYQARPSWCAEEGYGVAQGEGGQHPPQS